KAVRRALCGAALNNGLAGGTTVSCFYGSLQPKIRRYDKWNLLH
ncbi:hypothetical protein RUMCAL_02694, partial [Ruminococcus callidus ATCC 27760]